MLPTFLSPKIADDRVGDDVSCAFRNNERTRNSVATNAAKADLARTAFRISTSTNRGKPNQRGLPCDLIADPDEMAFIAPGGAKLVHA